MDTTVVLSPRVFDMPIFNIIVYIIAFIGFAGIVYIIATLIGIGRKLQMLDDLKITTDKIKKNLKVVCDFLVGSNLKLNPAEIQGYSPLSLTEEGKSFIKKIGFDNIFNLYKADFFKFIDNEKPKLKYDVELASIKSMSIFSDKEYMNFLKILFYNEPNRNMENTAPTLGLYVRDKYLVEHPEITE
jgi:hypothetical protein